MLSSKEKQSLVSGMANKSLANKISNDLEMRSKAMSGDIVLKLVPAVARLVTDNAFKRAVIISLVDAKGKLHEWADSKHTGALSIGDTSVAGTASIVSSDLQFKGGRASVVVSGDEASWLDTETNTLTVANLTVAGYTITGGTSVETITA